MSIDDETNKEDGPFDSSLSTPIETDQTGFPVSIYVSNDKSGITMVMSKYPSRQFYSPYGQRIFERNRNFMIFNCVNSLELTPELAEKYDKRFKDGGVKLLAYFGVEPEKANKYLSEFNVIEVMELHAEGVSPDYANKYFKQFNLEDLIELYKAGADEKNLDAYLSKFSPSGAVDLFKLPSFIKLGQEARYKSDIEDEKVYTVTFNQVMQYSSRFDGHDLALLVKNDIPADKANRYNPRFRTIDVVRFDSVGCSPETANSYDESFDGDTIYIFSRLDTSHKFDSLEKGRVSKVISKVVDYLKPGYIPETDTPKYTLMLTFLQIIGTGADGIVLLDKLGPFNRWMDDFNAELEENLRTRKFSQKIIEFIKSFFKKRKQNIFTSVKEYEKNKTLFVRKFSLDPEREFYFLSKLDNPKYVVKVKNYEKEDGQLMLEYIQGLTLANLISKYGPLPQDKLLQYSFDILNGIVELRENGIYHRDIHDRNIMIDSDLDRGVIIDLGVATEDPEEIYHLNRAYGGNNDLISLGQLMYKMATGGNLFNEGPGFTCYSAVKRGIKTKREQTYDNPGELVRCFENVRENVPGELGELIVTLLDDDLWTQPDLRKVQEAKKMFRRYVR